MALLPNYVQNAITLQKENHASILQKQSIHQ